MWFIWILVVLVLAATAQDPPDPPDPSDPLHPERVHQFSVATSPFDFFDKTQALPVYYTPGNQDQLIDPPGQNIQMENLYQNYPPWIARPNGVVEGSSYVIMMVCPDGPTLSTLIWLQTNLVYDGKIMSPKGNTTTLNRYRKPDPPGNQWYRYTFLLFDQPANFKIPSKFDLWVGPAAKTERHFDLAGFVKDSGLQTPVAANTFFTRGFYEKRDIVSRSSEAGGGALDAIPKDIHQLPQAKSPLEDIHQLPQAKSPLKVSASRPKHVAKTSSVKVAVAIIVTLTVVALLAAIIIFCFIQRRKKRLHWVP